MSKKPQPKARRPVGVAPEIQLSTAESHPHVVDEGIQPSAATLLTERTKEQASVNQHHVTIPDWYINPKEVRDFLAIYALEELENGRIPFFFQWACRRIASGVGTKIAFNFLGLIGKLVTKARPHLTATVKGRLNWASAQLRVEQAVTDQVSGVELLAAEKTATAAAHEANKVMDDANLPASHLGDQSSIGTPSVQPG